MLVVFNDKVLIVGGGIAGLAVALSISKSYTNIKLVDRLPLDKVKANRDHAHLLLGKGYECLLKLLQDFPCELSVVKKNSVDICKDFKWFTPYGLAPRKFSGMASLCMTNCQIKELLLSAISKTKNIELCYGVAKKSWEMGKFDLVLDCSGRGSFGEDDLLHAVVPNVQDSKMSYTSVWLENSEYLDLDWHYLLHESSELTEFKSCLAVRHQSRVQLTFAQPFGESPEKNHKSLRDFALSLGNGEVVSLIDRATVLSPVLSMKNMGENRMYDKYSILNKTPKWYIPLGDRLARFNPYFGLGMTFSFMSALFIAEELKVGNIGAAKANYLNRIYPFIEQNFQLISRIEKRWLNEKKVITNNNKWRSGYVNYLWEKGIVCGDFDYYFSLLRVFNRLDSVKSLLRPRFLAAFFMKKLIKATFGSFNFQIKRTM